MLDSEKSVHRLGQINNDIANSFLVMMIASEESVVNSIKDKNSIVVSHFIEFSKMEKDVPELLSDDNVWNYLMEVLPAFMAVNPSIGYQLFKDVLQNLGIKSRAQFTEWVAQNPVFLSLFRSSITCIQAYFDLDRHYEEYDDESSVASFIVRSMVNKLTTKEKEAAEKANNKINKYLWEDNSQAKHFDHMRIVSFAPMIRHSYSDTTWSGDDFVNQALEKIPVHISEIAQLEPIERGEDLGNTLLSIYDNISEFNKSHQSTKEWMIRYENNISRLDAHIAYNALKQNTGYAIDWQDAVSLIHNYIQSSQFYEVLKESPWGTPQGSLGIDFVDKVISKIID